MISFNSFYKKRKERWKFVFGLNWAERCRYRMLASNPKGLPWIQSHKICSNIQRTHSWMNHKNWYSYQKKWSVLKSSVDESERARARTLALLWINEMSVEKCMNKRNARFNAIKCEKRASIHSYTYIDLLRCCLPIAISFRLCSTGLRREWIMEWMHTLAKCLLFTYYSYYWILSVCAMCTIQKIALYVFSTNDQRVSEGQCVRVQPASNFTAVRTA